MANHDLPDKIIIIIIQILDVETTWLMGPFLRAGKRTFSLVHQTVALSNVDAVYFEGLLLATHFEDLDDAVDVSEANVPSHA
ncbi:unnamed protein product [Brassica oleracea var. botrytis]|uniref:(rape) hypothetical protein n=1 Tax=Brassica napus TaxID=3708 RepID=A0A816KPL3_BRANA|nr:unnamed protein product [Brassica napus]